MGILKRSFQRQTVFILTCLFIVGVAVALWNMNRLASTLVVTQAEQNASLYAQAIQEARLFYNSNVISTLSQVEEIHIGLDYKEYDIGIPNPATFLIELGQQINEVNPDVLVSLYSPFPFPERAENRNPLDLFEQEAWDYLSQHPEAIFARIESLKDKPVFRYAQADVMNQSCVACHNTHPHSPKTDWKVGDVRGILQIIQPLETPLQKTRIALRETLLVLGGISILAILGIVTVVGRLRQTSRELERKVVERTQALEQSNNALSLEQGKSEKLLLNILPSPIATQLKEGQSCIAESFEEVTILFADIVGFTELSAQMVPIDLVNFLNQIFSQFDQAAEQLQLEKIKTIGDAYMVVGGLPTYRADHANSVADMALAMQKIVENFNQSQAQRETQLPAPLPAPLQNYTLQIRIGINTGPVVAGVIGIRKFIYDLWGDAVNVAARMEASGLPNKIHVTEQTYQQLKHHYQFEERGMIPVKGIGEMKTYWLVDRRQVLQ